MTPILLKSIAIHLPFLSRYFCKSMPSPWQKVVYTPSICITIHLPLVSRYFCRSIRDKSSGMSTAAQHIMNGKKGTMDGKGKSNKDGKGKSYEMTTPWMPVKGVEKGAMQGIMMKGKAMMKGKPLQPWLPHHNQQQLHQQQRQQQALHMMMMMMMSMAMLSQTMASHHQSDHDYDNYDHYNPAEHWPQGH